MSVRDASVLGTHPAWVDACEVPAADRLAREWDCDPALIRVADARFSSIVASVIHGVLTYARFRKDRSAPEWTTQPLPVFMSGGGAHVSVYRSAVEDAFAKARVRMNFRPLNGPESSVARVPYSTADFARLSVAYGLTMDAQTIGERIPPDDIPDEVFQDPAEFITHEARYLDR